MQLKERTQKNSIRNSTYTNIGLFFFSETDYKNVGSRTKLVCFFSETEPEKSGYGLPIRMKIETRVNLSKLDIIFLKDRT